MSEALKLGLVQMTSEDRHEPNIAFASEMIRKASQSGCDLVAFPEVAGLMNRKIAKDREQVRKAADDPYINACKELAAKHKIWVHTGSTPVLLEGDQRFLNQSNLINPDGRIAATYNKIHLFDMYPDDRPPMLESKRYAPGSAMEMAQTPWGLWAMTICYDLRFPALYRAYAQAGASILFVPSAFTVPTGRAHWDILLRARAIECGAFVVAAAQVGTHTDGRETYGHGIVVDPWGRVLVDMEEEVGIAIVELDLPAVERARTSIPSLDHDRQFDSIS